MRASDNPFFHRGPILDPAYFFDRKDEIADILGLVANTQNCSVVGAVKRGKTSVLLQLRSATGATATWRAGEPALHAGCDQTLRAHGLDPACCLRPYLSMEGLANVTPEAFFHCLLREVLRCPGSPAIPAGHDRLSPLGELRFSELQAAFDDLARAGANVVFLIDEFELAGENPNFDLNFFSALRSLASRPNCAFVIATEQRLDQLKLGDREVGSPFADLFTSIRLKRFTRAAVGEMITALSERSGRLWEVSLDCIMDWTGGSPYLVQLACSLLWRRSAGATKPLTEADYDYVREEFLIQSEPHMHHIWRPLSPREKEAALSLVAPGGGAAYVATGATGAPGCAGCDQEALQSLVQKDWLVERNGVMAIPSLASRAFLEARLREREHGASEFLVAERVETGVAPAVDKRTIYAVVRALVKATEARDHFTRGHSDGTAHLAVAIAQRMGLSSNEVEGIKVAARLHDIGKIGVSDLILLKPDKLTDKERDLVKAHVLVSAHILEALDFPWEVKPAVRFHHERLDGSGYPDGLIGDEIPLSARVLAVADVFTAMISARSHRSPHPREEAITEVTRHAGTKYDPLVVSAFIQVLEGGGV